MKTFISNPRGSDTYEPGGKFLGFSRIALEWVQLNRIVYELTESTKRFDLEKIYCTQTVQKFVKKQKTLENQMIDKGLSTRGGTWTRTTVMVIGF